MIPFYYMNDEQIPYAPDLSIVGYLPSFLDERDPDPAAKQIDKNYQFGGWHPMREWEFHARSLTLKYPGDPFIEPVAHATLRDETILFYRSAWVCIVQKDGSFEVARVD